MKDGLKIIGMLIVAIVISGWVSNLFEAKAPTVLSGVWSRTPAHNIATSSLLTVGGDLAERVLKQLGGRTEASLCNVDEAVEVYLFNATTTAHEPVGQTSTTTASTLIRPNTCYQIDRDNLFTGSVYAMKSTTGTSSILLIKELIGF